MIRKLTGVLAACAFAVAALAPATADAQHRRHGGYYDHGDYGRHYRHRDRHDEVAAGVVGLVLGLTLGSLVSQPRRDCYDNYRGGCGAPPPPRRCYDPCATQGGYYDPRYDRGYDPRYGDRRYEDEYGEPLDGGYYEDDGYPPPRRAQCTRRVWDDYERRFVTEAVPC